MNQYKIIKELGEGAFSSVLLATDTKSNSSVAIKKMKKKHWKDSAANAEIDILKKLNPHPNIVCLLDSFRHEYHSYLVFEFMSANLLDYMRDFITPRADLSSNSLRKDFDLFILHIGLQLFKAIQYIHTFGIFHRDIKPENILISPSPNNQIIAKLADFGQARYFLSAPPAPKNTHTHPQPPSLTDSKDQPNPLNPLNSLLIKKEKPLTEYISTRWYRAPEVLIGAKDYSLPIDVWAAGATLAEIALNRPLLPGINDHDQLRRIFSAILLNPYSKSHLSPPREKRYSTQTPEHHTTTEHHTHDPSNTSPTSSHFHDPISDWDEGFDSVYKLRIPLPFISEFKNTSPTSQSPCDISESKIRVKLLPTLMLGVSKEIVSLIQYILVLNPSIRPSASKVVSKFNDTISRIQNTNYDSNSSDSITLIDDIKSHQPVYLALFNKAQNIPQPSSQYQTPARYKKNSPATSISVSPSPLPLTPRAETTTTAADPNNDWSFTFFDSVVSVNSADPPPNRPTLPQTTTLPPSEQFVSENINRLSCGSFVSKDLAHSPNTVPNESSFESSRTFKSNSRDSSFHIVDPALQTPNAFSDNESHQNSCLQHPPPPPPPPSSISSSLSKNPFGFSKKLTASLSRAASLNTNSPESTNLINKLQKGIFAKKENTPDSTKEKSISPTRDIIKNLFSSLNTPSSFNNSLSTDNQDTPTSRIPRSKKLYLRKDRSYTDSTVKNIPDVDNALKSKNNQYNRVFYQCFYYPPLPRLSHSEKPKSRARYTMYSEGSSPSAIPSSLESSPTSISEFDRPKSGLADLADLTRFGYENFSRSRVFKHSPDFALEKKVLDSPTSKLEYEKLLATKISPSQSHSIVHAHHTPKSNTSTYTAVSSKFPLAIFPVRDQSLGKDVLPSNRTHSNQKQHEASRPRNMTMPHAPITANKSRFLPVSKPATPNTPNPKPLKNRPHRESVPVFDQERFRPHLEFLKNIQPIDDFDSRAQVSLHQKLVTSRSNDPRTNLQTRKYSAAKAPKPQVGSKFPLRLKSAKARTNNDLVYSKSPFPTYLHRSDHPHPHPHHQKPQTTHSTFAEDPPLLLQNEDDTKYFSSNTTTTTNPRTTSFKKKILNRSDKRNAAVQNSNNSNLVARNIITNTTTSNSHGNTNSQNTNNRRIYKIKPSQYSSDSSRTSKDTITANESELYLEPNDYIPYDTEYHLENTENKYHEATTHADKGIEKDAVPNNTERILEDYNDLYIYYDNGVSDKANKNSDLPKSSLHSVNKVLYNKVKENSSFSKSRKISENNQSNLVLVENPELEHKSEHKSSSSFTNLYSEFDDILSSHNEFDSTRKFSGLKGSKHPYNFKNVYPRTTNHSNPSRINFMQLE
ncbi:hypothetical protein BB560_005440 [Smittium megazygosporum]|uniref:Protein kinase domain-containing protein n=1 Tax=Smittium megazygosporum TaxID=133381 RepID=A0A2T9Z5C2_9FUNG|nr:hypothetical protein BB560_005440 [Smittium megazygosporum]